MLENRYGATKEFQHVHEWDGLTDRQNWLTNVYLLTLQSSAVTVFVLREKVLKYPAIQFSVIISAKITELLFALLHTGGRKVRPHNLNNGAF